MADINAIAEQIQGLTLLEASQLVKLLEEKLGRFGGGGFGRGGSSGGRRRCSCRTGRRKDRIHRYSDGRRREQDQCYQGCSRSYQPWSEGSQGSGRWRAEADQRRREQGRSRNDQEEVRRRRRHCRSQVIPSLWAFRPVFLLNAGAGCLFGQ